MIILHVITGLGNGGAENQLLRLIEGSPPQIKHHVVNLGASEQLAPEFSKSALSVFNLKVTNPFKALFVITRLTRIIKELRPDAVQTWLPHAMLIGTIAAVFSGNRKLFWNIRSSSYSSLRSLRGTHTIVRTLALLSRFAPQAIISCGPVATNAHVNLGYRASKFVDIPNGYGTPTDFDRSKKQSIFRSKHSIPKEQVIIGMLARYHPLKDHATLIQALGLVKETCSSFHVVLAGRGVDSGNESLTKKIADAGLTELTTLVGEVSAGSELFQVLDLHVLSSRSEGFPNVIAEAALHGVPNVSTNAGEAAQIIGNERWIAPIGIPEKLAATILDFLGLSKGQILEMTSQQTDRVRKKFGLEACVDAYSTAWSSNSVTGFTRFGLLGASSRIRWHQFEQKLRDRRLQVESHALISSKILARSYEHGWRPTLDIFYSYLARVLQLLCARRQDVLWIQRELFPFLPWSLERLLIPRNSRVIVDFDDAVYLSYEKSENPILRVLLRKKIEGICRRADIVTVGSSALREAVRQRGAQRIELIPSVPTEFPSARRSQTRKQTKGPFIVGWVGSPSTWRAYGDIHLRFISPLLKELDLEFHIYGAHLQNARTRRNGIRFLPWSIQSEAEIFASIDVGVMLLPDDEWSRAKCGYKILQYYAAGLPVLASKVGWNAEIMEHGKNGFFVSSPIEMKRYLDALRTDSNLRDRISRANLDTYRTRFDPEGTGALLSSLINELASESKSRQSP